MLRFGEIFRMKRPGVIGTWFTFSVNQQNAQGGPLLSQAQGDQPVGQSRAHQNQIIPRHSLSW